MDRAVIADHNCLETLKNLSCKHGFIPGLMLGQTTIEKDFIAFFAPTPHPGDGEDGTKVQAVGDLDRFDDKWISFHTKNVLKYLPGGISVVGVFILTSDDGRDSLIINKLRALAGFVYTGSKSNPFLLNFPRPHQLLLQYSSTTNKFVCMRYDASQLNSSLQSVNFKFSGTLSDWIQVKSSLYLSSIGLQSVPCKNGLYSLKNLLKASLEELKRKLDNCICSLDDCFVSAKDIVGTFKENRMNEGKEKGSSDVILANLYYRGDVGNETFKVDVTDSCQMVKFGGAVVIRVFVNRKGTVEDTLEALKEDALRSCSIKFEMQWQSNDDQLPVNVKDESVVAFLPEKVVVSAPGVPIEFSEYLFPGESSEELLSSIQLYFNLPSISTNLVKSLETPSIEMGQRVAENVSSQKTGKKLFQRNSFLFFGIILALLVLCGSLLIQFFLQSDEY